MGLNLYVSGDIISCCVVPEVKELKLERATVVWAVCSCSVYDLSNIATSLVTVLCVFTIVSGTALDVFISNSLSPISV